VKALAYIGNESRPIDSCSEFSSSQVASLVSKSK
jgi:hypothetical protein